MLENYLSSGNAPMHFMLVALCILAVLLYFFFKKGKSSLPVEEQPPRGLDQRAAQITARLNAGKPYYN